MIQQNTWNRIWSLYETVLVFQHLSLCWFCSAAFSPWVPFLLFLASEKVAAFSNNKATNSNERPIKKVIQLICNWRKCNVSEGTERKEQKIIHGREGHFWSWQFWFDFSEPEDHKSIGSWPWLDLVHLEHLCSGSSLYHRVCDMTCEFTVYLFT